MGGDGADVTGSEPVLASFRHKFLYVNDLSCVGIMSAVGECMKSVNV